MSKKCTIWLDRVKSNKRKKATRQRLARGRVERLREQLVIAIANLRDAENEHFHSVDLVERARVGAMEHPQASAVVRSQADSESTVHRRRGEILYVLRIRCGDVEPELDNRNHVTT